jgi:hypothetical protein|tara:strand:+ start:834 stop:986 length:153 start_codon:yes stop_codon:yes gene_type:complete
MIRLLYLGLLVYVAVMALNLISRKLRTSQEKETPASQSVIDVEAQDADQK